MHLRQLHKKASAGAAFLITQPIFDMERFLEWWHALTATGIHEKVAILAGIRVLNDADQARTYAARRPDPRVPKSLLERLASKSDREAQQTEAIAIALETMERLSSLEGLRGFEIDGDHDGPTVLEVMTASRAAASPKGIILNPGVKGPKLRRELSSVLKPTIVIVLP